MLKIATICGFLPQIFILLFVGVWIDCYNRKYLIILSDFIIALTTLLLSIAYFSGYRYVELLFIILIVRSLGTGIQTPTVNAIIPQLVQSEHLMKINGINSILSSFMMFVSPVVSAPF